MAAQSEFQVKFWGVRGSIPTPHHANLGFGGNTACIEIRMADGDIVIIDGGTGIRNLGAALQQERSEGASLDVFLTHFHWDHIQGLPFFAPLYNASNRVCFHSGRPPAEMKDILEGQMSYPYFPVQFELLHAQRDFVLAGPEGFRRGSLTIRPFPLNHPQTAVGYRFESNGKVLVHASDCEHGHDKLDSVLRDRAQGADILIYDSQFTPEEYDSKKGWGHSTCFEGTRIANECGVKQLVLFHHDPQHDNEFVKDIADKACRVFPNTVPAREGAVLAV